MDPISIVSGLTGLVGAVLKSIQTINKYQGLYARSAITIASITAQCSCIEFAFLQVQETILNNPQNAYRLRSDSALSRHFQSVFGACQLVFCILDERLTALIDAGVNKHGEIGTMGKIKMVWNDQEMKDILLNIESQASAVNLLLGALQMKSNADIHDLLARRDSQKLLDRVSNDASSLRSAEDTKLRKSIADGNITPSLHSTFDEIEFAFDFEIINTATYRKAFQHASRMNIPPEGTSKNLVLRKPVATKTTSIISEEDLLLDMSTEGDEKVEEIVSDGAKQLSNPVPHGLASYGHFTAPPHVAQVITPIQHQFHVAEIISAEQPSEPISISEHCEPLTNVHQEDSMFDIHRALENMMLSQFEDAMPTFLFDAEKHLIAETASRNERLGDNSLSSTALYDPVTDTPFDATMTSHNSKDANHTEPDVLIDLSVPDALEYSPMSAILQDLMEIETEERPADAILATEKQESSAFGPVDDFDMPETMMGPGIWELIPKSMLNLQTFLEYMAEMQQSILPFPNEYPVDSYSKACVQRIYPIAPRKMLDPSHEAGGAYVPAAVPSGDFSCLVNYSLEQMLHSTSSSKVVMGKRAYEAQLFAIKIVSCETCPTSQNATDRSDNILLEVAILHDLSHYNIIRIHELIELEMQFVMVMFYASPLTLLQYIREQRRGVGVWCFPVQTSWSIFRQLVSAMSYLHENRTLHRNITLDNILFDSRTEHVVLKGFGIAEIMMHGGHAFDTQQSLKRPKFLNPYFTAPEVLAGSDDVRRSTPVLQRGKNDVFSCGAILFTMINGVLPYGGNILMTQFGPFHAAEHLSRLNATPVVKALSTHKGDDDTYGLLMAVLEHDPKNRHDIRQLSRHSWMRQQPESDIGKDQVTQAVVTVVEEESSLEVWLLVRQLGLLITSPRGIP